MNINITILVQIVHFYIAYLILYKFLLKPVMAILQQEASLKRDWEIQVVFAKQALERAEYLKQCQWQEFSAFAKTQVPSIAPRMVEQLIKRQPPAPLLADGQRVLVDEVKQAIMQELSHVH